MLLTSAKEFLRHFLYRTFGYGALSRRRSRLGRPESHLQKATLAARFADIYEKDVWRFRLAAETPKSGPGSSLAATERLRAELPLLLNRLGAKTLIDVGCGDFTWMQHVALEQAYIGLDVVASVIEANREAHAAPHRRFLFADATQDEIPDGDVVLLREILFHLSFDDIARVLRNVLAKPRAYVVATSDPSTLFNSDIPTGDFRVLNLEMRPLRFPKPLHSIADDAVTPGRFLGVWRAGALHAALKLDESGQESGASAPGFVAALLAWMASSIVCSR